MTLPPNVRLAFLRASVVPLNSLVLLVVAIAVSLPHESASAQDVPPAEAKPRVNFATLHADVKRRLHRLQPQIASEKEANASPETRREYDLLSWLDLTCVQVIELEKKQQEVSHQIEESKFALDAIRRFGLPEAPPYSYLMLDDIRNEILTVDERLQSLRRRAKGMTSALESARVRKDAAETKRRLAEEARSSSANAATKETLREDYELALLTSQATKAALEQLRAEVKLNQAEREVAALQLEILKHKENIIEDDVRFTSDDLTSRLTVLDKTEALLRNSLSVRFSEISNFQRQADSDSTPQLANDQPATDVAGVQIKVRQEEIGIIHQLLRELVELRAVWRWRYELFNGLTSVEQRHQWKDVLENAAIRMDSLRETLKSRMDELRDQMIAVRKETLARDDPPGSRSETLALHNAELDRSLQFLGEQMVLTRAGHRLILKASAETQSAIEPDSQGSAFAEASYWFERIWNYEIAVVDDRSITFGKIVCGVLLFLGGVFLARQISRSLGRRLLPRLGFNEAGVLAFQSICFYTLLCSFTFIVLEFVNVPVTGFAFLGGAIAIGVGFGSQNILNNFISGLIILAERPVRPGDLVEIDGLSANIEHIGARSTRVKTGENLEIVVPNSKFLENNVTNWTLSDTRIRVSVSVGVAYGSPTSEVIARLEAAAQEHPKVLNDPCPIVLFTDFGDNALTFECHFWVQMRTKMQGEQIRSDIRCRIDESLAEAGISIAFPQRDVHLDTTRPLEINLNRLGNESASRLRPAA